MHWSGIVGLGVGAAYGYVAQRGAFCLNSGFRLVVTKRDTTKLKAYALAVAVQMLLVPALFWWGISRPNSPGLLPFGALAGGLLFGASMAWAGGCAAGVWYKLGAGSLASGVALLGMGLGATLMEVGPLSRPRAWLQSVGFAVEAPEGLWSASPALGAALLVGLLWRGGAGKAGDWSWQRTGLGVGLVGALAWAASSAAGRDFGLAVVPGTVSLLDTPLLALGPWDVWLVIGMPLGAYAAARVAGPVGFTGAPPTALLKRFVGGLGLGFGASLAAGCTVGHGLTGAALLAPGSLWAIACIFAGSALQARASMALAR